MRTLDNSLRTILRELNLFSPEWPQDRRKEFIQKINEFANAEEILPVIRRYYEQLGLLISGTEVEGKEDAQEVFRCIMRMLMAIGSSEFTPFPDPNALRKFLVLVKTANTTEEVLSTIDQSY